MKNVTPKQALLKHFSSVLSKRAKTNVSEGISPSILKHFSRRELIEILLSKYTASRPLPKQYNLMEMENEELLSLIGDDMFILSYLAQKWCAEVEVPPVLETPTSLPPKEKPKVSPSKPTKEKSKAK